MRCSLSYGSPNPAIQSFGHFWEWLLTAVLEQCPRASVPCSRNLFALVSPYSPALDCTAIDRRENFLPMTNCTTARRQIFLIFDKHSFRWTIPKAVWIFKMRDKQKMVQARMWRTDAEKERKERMWRMKAENGRE